MLSEDSFFFFFFFFFLSSPIILHNFAHVVLFHAFSGISGGNFLNGSDEDFQ